MKKKILVIDDSALMRRVISDIINSDSDLEVVKIARNGLEGYEAIVENPTLYDAVVLDINMPKMTGLEVLERLQKDRIRVTVVVASTVAKEGAEETMKALDFGAFDFITKPETGLVGRDVTFMENLLKTVKTAAAYGARRIRLFGDSRTVRPKPQEVKPAVKTVRTDFQTRNTIQTTDVRPADGKIRKIVALACSTGGPKSLQSVIPKLPANLDAPVVLVQHMPKGFTASLAQRLDSLSNVTVCEATDNEILKKGTVYIAPGGKHLCVKKDSTGQLRTVIDDSPAVDALKPCANVMYKSLEDIPVDLITCVVLTGMGADGTKGITALAKKRNIHVIAQDEATSVVYGMPKAIYEAGVVDEVCPLEQIADAITKNVGVS